MKHTETKLQQQSKTYSLNTISDCLELSARAKNLSEVWRSTEPTFNAIKRELGVNNLKKLLLIEVAKMVMLLKADMQEIHIEHFVDYILKHYPAYTISDITSFTDVLLRVKPYGKPTLRDLTYELDQYSIEREEYAVDQRVKENSKHKAEHIQDDRFFKMYERMKEEAKKPKVTQKQKDAEARRINEEKIEQMRRDGLL